MINEDTLRARLTDFVCTRYGLTVAKGAADNTMEFDLPPSAEKRGDILVAKYTKTCTGRILTIVLEIHGVYGPDRSGRCLLERNPIMDEKQLIPWNIKALKAALRKWFGGD